jgi:hypothetical protein
MRRYEKRHAAGMSDTVSDQDAAHRHDEGNYARDQLRSIAMKTNRLFAIALACAVGMGVGTEIASAQTTAGTRRGSGGSGGSTTGTSGPSSGTSYGVEERHYLPYELDKPIEEFFLGQTAYTQPQGSFQATIGGALDVGSDGVQLNSMLARGEYGITNNFEVHAAVPVTLSQTTRSTGTQSSLDPNFERIELGAMYAITPMNDPIALSAALDVDVPIASGSADQTVFKPSIIGAYDFGPTELHSDVQAELGGAARGLNFDAGLAYSLGEFVPTLEYNVRATEGAHPQMYATPGLYYNFSNRTELGVGVPIGLNDLSETGIMAKLNLAFGR